MGDHSHSDFDPKDYAVQYVKHLNSLHKKGAAINDLQLGEESNLVREIVKTPTVGKRSSYHKTINGEMKKMMKKNRSAFFDPASPSRRRNKLFKLPLSLVPTHSISSTDTS